MTRFDQLKITADFHVFEMRSLRARVDALPTVGTNVAVRAANGAFLPEGGRLFFGDAEAAERWERDYPSPLEAVPNVCLGLLAQGPHEHPVTDEHRRRFARVVEQLLEHRVPVAKLFLDPIVIPLTGLAADGTHALIRSQPIEPWHFMQRPVEIEEHGKRFTAMQIVAPDDKPIATYRAALLWYFHTTKTREAVNSLIGFEACVDEGSLPSLWPEWA